MEPRISVCPICGKEFEKTRSDKRYCSRKCAYIANARSARARNSYLGKKIDLGCPHNTGLICYKRTCSSCGWHPTVEAQRREKLGLNPVEG